MAANTAVAMPLPDPENEARGAAQVERSARALIGWMRPEDAQRTLLGTRADAAPLQKHLDAIRAARDAVANRSDGIDQKGITTDRPAVLDDHIAALRATPAAGQMFAAGWNVALVDLRLVCGFQPVVFSEQAVERVAAIPPDDVVAMAQETLPISTTTELPIQFDQVRNAWMISSANPNLRVVSATSGRDPNGLPILGFAVTVGQSFMQVVRHRNRWFLRDGYHRAFGLLARGIHVVPAFVREMTAFEEVVPDPRVMLPQDSYQGPRPPMLPDYLDDTIAASVRIPAMHKMIVVQALELSPIG